MSHGTTHAHAVIVGAGFCGLTAAYELVKQGIRVTVLEQEATIGGLAASFFVNGERLEKFYHHWFTSDTYITQLVDELGVTDKVLTRSTRTGLFFANSIYRLSSPIDVLRFTPLNPLDRARLAWLAVRAKHVKDWRCLENLTAAQWLRSIAGDRVFRVVWQPLLRGKFGEYAETVSAVWFWNKLKLRGGSRGKRMGEQLAYYKGGFSALADRMALHISLHGGEIRTCSPVTSLMVSGQRCIGVVAGSSTIPADVVIFTPALPLFAGLVEQHTQPDYVTSLRRVKYLANVCLILELDRSLSSTYWLNVNDPGFPFVGVIEHTNFEPADTYGGRHIVYLSKYLPETDQLYTMGDDSVFNFTLPHLSRMFPTFSREWVRKFHVWRARYSQPIVERNYGALVPQHVTPIERLYLASMAQIYPEDRGTNYAVREGKRAAKLAVEALGMRAAEVT